MYGIPTKTLCFLRPQHVLPVRFPQPFRVFNAFSLLEVSLQQCADTSFLWKLVRRVYMNVPNN